MILDREARVMREREREIERLTNLLARAEATIDRQHVEILKLQAELRAATRIRIPEFSESEGERHVRY